MTDPSTQKSRLPAAGWVLVSLSALMCGLAVFQWVELLVVRRGGQSVCQINSVLNCEKVWNSPAASRLHHLLGMPVAGLGLAWGLTALVMSYRLVLKVRRGEEVRPALPALWITAGVGILSCLGFVGLSVQAAAICLTCLGTYLLVGGFAAVAFGLLPGPKFPKKGEWQSALLWPGAVAAGCYALLLIPGLSTPEAPSSTVLSHVEGDAASKPSSPQDDQATLGRFLTGLPQTEKQALSDALSAYRGLFVPPGAFGFSPKSFTGAPDAPMRLVDFTDIRCSHCRHLEETLHEARRVLPPNHLTVESRYFPLDGECNPLIKQSSGDGVRCLGAKAEICLEKAPDFVSLQEKLFEEQEHLTRNRILEIASSGSVSRADLEKCIDRSETTDRILEDVRYAEAYNIQGTPLVLINGKEGAPAPAFLYSMALSGANPDAPIFASMLPKPEPQAAQ